MVRRCCILVTISVIAVVAIFILSITIRRQQNFLRHEQGWIYDPDSDGMFNEPNPEAMLLHQVYHNVGECQGDDYITFTTPFGQCYNRNTYDGRKHYDVFDEILEWNRNTGLPTFFGRTYFWSTDGTCQNRNKNISCQSSLGGSSSCTTYGSSSGSSRSELEKLVDTGI